METSLLAPASKEINGSGSCTGGSMTVEGCECEEAGRERLYLLLEQLIWLGEKSSKADKLLGSQVLIQVLNRNS